MTLIVSGTMTIDPAKMDEVAAAAAAMMEETHKEEGNIAYAFSKDFNNSALIHVYEKWESQEALDAHMAAPHMVTFMEAMGGFGIADASIRKHEVSGESDLF